MVMTYTDLNRNFYDLRIDHHSSPAGEIYLYKFALRDRLQDIPCVTHGKFPVDLHPLNFLKPCNVLIFSNFLITERSTASAYQAPL